jgi:hypothetical protein
VNEARIWQAQGRNRAPEPADPEAVDRERVRALDSRGADIAAAVLSATGWAPLPLGDDLAPSGGPLATHSAVYDHFRHRHSDGVGLTLGAQLGALLVAVSGTAMGWQEWTREVAVESSQSRFEDGSGEVPGSGFRDLGRYVTVIWQPPPSAQRTTGVAVGTPALNAAAESMRPRRLGEKERGWCLWATPTASDGALGFPASRKLGHGLEVLGAGIVPVHAVRRDGWRIQLSGLPVTEAMPPWLVAELGGRWTTTKAGAK